MTAKEVINTASRATGISQAKAAESLGWSPQQLSAKISRKTLRADDFLNLLDSMGVDVTYTVRETGKSIKAHIPGAGRRVRAMVNKVIYDTAYSDALSNDFYIDGDNMLLDGKGSELYIDSEGRYFLAEYTSFEGVKDRIIPLTANDAAAYIRRNGTDLHRQPANAAQEQESQNE